MDHLHPNTCFSTEKASTGRNMAWPGLPIASHNIYMEEPEPKALTSFSGTFPNQQFSWMDDIWVKIEIKRVDATTHYLGTSGSLLKMSGSRAFGLPGLCRTHWSWQKPQCWEVQKEHRHGQTWCLHWLHHPLWHKLGVIQTLNHRAEVVPLREVGKEKNHTRKGVVLLVGPFLNPQRRTKVRWIRSNTAAL